MKNVPIPFTDEYVDSIVSALDKRHSTKVGANEDFRVSGEIAQGHALVAVALESRDRTFRVVAEACVEVESNELENPIAARDIAIDCVDSWIGEFLESERSIRLSPGWKTHAYEGALVLMKGEVTNPVLEDEADRFLAERGYDRDGTAEPRS